MKVLVACEFSGIVRHQFEQAGHNAWSCDILPSEAPGKHYQGDVIDILDAEWDLMIAHPPCTFLANSGVQHLHTDPQRWVQLHDAVAMFRALLAAPVPRICIENPIPHKYARNMIGRKYDQLIQPYQFGHPERKATCLWLKGLDPLVHTNDVRLEMEKLPKSQQQRIFHMSPGPNRSHERSRFYTGFARAMAEQWGL